MLALSSTRSRLSLLRSALASSMASLDRRRAADIPNGYIDDYVALNWLRWDGGHLRLTTVGSNILQQLTLQMKAE